MKYAYEDLSPEQFEGLIVLLCKKLLGVSVKGFAKGPDGGRDAKFIGKAELFPSTTAPWNGTVIIQAKHTNGYNKSFSEADFFSVKSNKNILAEEIPRIEKLRKKGELDHYMLFANRRLSGNADSAIQSHIAEQCDIPIGSIYLCGLEQLEVFLKDFPDVPHRAALDPIDSPLIVSPDDLSEVVQALVQHKEVVEEVADDPPTPRVPYNDKNELNNMSVEYAKAQRTRFLKETAQIKTFLAAPENLDLLRLYETVIDEFQLNIIAKRKDYQSFDDVMNHLVDLLFNRDPHLRANKRLTRAILFYMYWNCDIGENGDAKTD